MLRASAWLFVLMIGSWASPVAAQWRHGVVAADHRLASEAGIEVMRAGGNVVDAAVATSFALAVVRPASCGLGGGGFMMVYSADTDDVIAIDYRERAPSASSPEMYLQGPTDASRRGALAAGIPGTVAGLCYAHKTRGKLPFEQVIAPAIRLARDGYEVDEHSRKVQASMIQRFQDEGLQATFATLWKTHLGAGKPFQEGQRVTSPLLNTLLAIRDRGEEGFYQGEIAKSMLATLKEHGGIMTEFDFHFGKKIALRNPIQCQFGDTTIYSMPPPSSGGVALAQTLGVMQGIEANHATFRYSSDSDPARSTHVLAESMKHAFADRARYLGDPEFVRVPIEQLLAPERISKLAQTIDFTRTQPTETYGNRSVGDDSGTSHFSVMDDQGNAVACTETINGTFGSYLMDPTSGVVFNNEMDDFTARPGEPNMYGLIQSEANAVAPGKRPLSSMTPSIGTRDSKAVFAAGASGGPRIISATIQVILNHIRKGMSPQEAVAAPRIHHQWQPDILRMPAGTSPELRSKLESLGHQITIGTPSSASQMAVRNPDGTLSGGSDPRKGGMPRGH